MKKSSLGKAHFKKKRPMKALAAIIAALIVLTGIAGCRLRNDMEQVVNLPQNQTSTDTAAQSEEPRTAEPMDSLETEQEQSKEEKLPSFSITRQVNGRAEWHRYSQRLLAGEDIEEQACTLRGGAVFFGMEDNELLAYNKALLFETDEGIAYELFEPIASFPQELGAAAQKSLSDYYRRNLNPAFSGDDTLQMMGYFGEDYVIFTNEVFHGNQAAAIFRTADGGKTWTEFPVAEDYPMEITGGCILSDKIGFLCYADRNIIIDGYTPRQLTIYKTEDGGKTWKDIELWIPETDVGMIAEPTIALSPMFDGEHGIMLVTYSEYVKQRDAFDCYIGWFESFDGGESWKFYSDPSAKLGR